MSNEHSATLLVRDSRKRIHNLIRQMANATEKSRWQTSNKICEELYQICDHIRYHRRALARQIETALDQGQSGIGLDQTVLNIVSQLFPEMKESVRQANTVSKKVKVAS